MALGYAFVALVAAAVAVFALQNSAPTSIRFAVWSLDGVPLAGLILVSLVAGIIVAGVPLLIQRWRLRSRVRALERRVQTLESTSSERAITPAPPRSSPPPPPAMTG
jgi:lipopolysaccharide assembly protein A